MLDHMQPTNSSLVLHPLSLPLPNEIQLGQTRVTDAQGEFMQAIDAGIESSCQNLSTMPEMSADALYDALIAAITDGLRKHEGSLTLDQWRLGFVIGQMIGLLNPDLISGNPALSCLELLSCKYQRLYPIGEHPQERGTTHA